MWEVGVLQSHREIDFDVAFVKCVQARRSCARGRVEMSGNGCFSPRAPAVARGLSQTFLRDVPRFC